MKKTEYTREDYYNDLAAENDLPIIEVEDLLTMLKRKYEDTKQLTELPPLPRVYVDRAVNNDCGIYISICEESPGLVSYFLRACKIDNKYYYYTANFC